MSQMLKSTGAMGVATLASRILGMARETVYANFMGAGPVAGAFNMAQTVPNLFRRLLGEGALTAAFIPIFKEKEKREGEERMWLAANAVISGLFVAAVAITLVVIIGISVLLFLDAQTAASTMQTSVPELSEIAGRWFSPETRLMLQLARVMFPYMLLVCLAAILMGMLNARGHFFVPALGASLLNVILIISVLFVAPRIGERLETQIFALAVGMLVAGAAQALYQLPALHREGFRLRWVSPWSNETVRQVIGKMIPGMMGVAAFQINVLVTQGMAWSVDPEIVAAFGYAVRLMEFPQGIFGISLATYLLPTLAGLAADKKFPEFRQTYKDAVGYLMFINLIAAVLLVVLAKPMVRLLFEHGKFSAYDTQRAGFALACLAPGLLCFTLVNITARAFYALGDTNTPMKISAVCLMLNILFAAFLIRPLEEGGMGVANTLSALFNVYFLLFALRKKLKYLEVRALTPVITHMVGAAILAGEVCWLVRDAWTQLYGHATLLSRLGEVFLPIGAASAVYFAVLLLLKVPQAQDFYHALRIKLLREK